jgi:hypothetical protein
MVMMRRKKNENRLFSTKRAFAAILGILVGLFFLNNWNESALEDTSGSSSTPSFRGGNAVVKESSNSGAMEVIAMVVNNEVKIGATSVVNKEKCLAAINVAVAPLLKKKAIPTMLSVERKQNVVDSMAAAVVDPTLIGDWVETGTWKGGASLLAAVVQRTAVHEKACDNSLRRSIWLADSFEGLPPAAGDEKKDLESGYTKNMDKAGSYAFEGGIETVKQLFLDHGFAVDGSGDVPIYFLKGWFENTLPDSPIKDIAVLRLDGDMYSSTLQALFALYRRVPINGYVIIDDYGHWPQCQVAIDEFFVDANIDLQYIDYTGSFFIKSNIDVRVPEKYNKKHVARHPKVWHERSERLPPSLSFPLF